MVRLLALMAFLVFSGCAVHKHDGKVHLHTLVEVMVPEGHIHDLVCGHCRHQGRWYFQKDHLHGPDCGHSLEGALWVIDDQVHLHTQECGHVFTEGFWISKE